MDWTTVLLWLLAVTALFEIITCIGRFGLRMRSRNWKGRYSRFTFGKKVHHGYVGSAMFPAVFFLPFGGMEWLFIFALAGGLVLSDLIHHFVVLPIFTGEFD